MSDALSRLSKWGKDCPKHFSKEPADVDPDELPSWIVYEDESLLVMNKPGWLVCHPAKRGPMSSLLSACREYCGIDKLHIINRLDRETSGLTLIAKNLESANELRNGLAAEQTRKSYLAVMDGVLSDKIIVEGELGDDQESEIQVKQTVLPNGEGKSAKTEFNPLTTNANRTLAEVRLHTGRKHQIRAHAVSIGHHIIGDKMYGPDERLYLDFIDNGWNESLEKALEFPRQALHAWKLSILNYNFQANPPLDFQRLLDEEFPGFQL